MLRCQKPCGGQLEIAPNPRECIYGTCIRCGALHLIDYSQTAVNAPTLISGGEGFWTRLRRMLRQSKYGLEPASRN